MNPLPLGSYFPAVTIEKWALLNERDRLFESYCQCLEKLAVWESKQAQDISLGTTHKVRQESIYTMRGIIRKVLDDLTAQLLDLDDRITEMGRIEPEDTLEN